MQTFTDTAPAFTGLSFAEEVLLLALDDRKGVLRPLPSHTLKLGLAGAFLLELALSGHIDTDTEVLSIVRSTPTDTLLLNEILTRIQKADTPRPAAHWLKEIAWQMPEMEERVLESLVKKGVLRVENHKILWVFTSRRYPVMDGREIREVQSRLRDLITGDSLPDARDAVLVGLVHACHLFEGMFTDEELDRYSERIRNLARLELIGREVNRAIAAISLTITESMSASISGIL